MLCAISSFRTALRLDIELGKLTDAVGSKFGGAEEREKSLKEAFKVSKQIICQVGG